ncbi:hypothetical protein [Robbsia sp. KACC 23696]|uniref:hypothetical protein n=1 Tax=Robbsia sp. KACC 23696 TaxID=3149231 RepID=UPI00325B93EE
MSSAIGLAGTGAVPGLIGWHAVEVTDGSSNAALAAAISGASANAHTAQSLQRTVMDRLSHYAAPDIVPDGADGSSPTEAELHRRHAARVDAAPSDRDMPAARHVSGSTGDAPVGRAGEVASTAVFTWRPTDHVYIRTSQTLRQQVISALDALQDLVRVLSNGGNGANGPVDDRSAPLAVGYFQQDQDLTPDAALAVSLTAAASRAPRTDALADALGHMLSLSASTTPAMLSALRQADDGGESESESVAPPADASAVTHRTLQRALQLLAEQQSALPADRHTPLREVRAAFAPARIAPFDGSVRIGIARHWSGTIASVQTASSFTTIMAPSDEADPFMRNMLHTLSRRAGGASSESGRGTDADTGGVRQILDPAFVAEALDASIVFLGDSVLPSPGAASGPSDTRGDAALSAIDAFISRLVSLCDGDETVVQALSRRLHQSSLLAAAMPAIARYAVDDDPQRLLLPGTDAPGQWVLLGDTPTFHVDLWTDPGGGVCADTEVKWPIAHYGVALDAGVPSPGRAAVVTEADTVTAWAPTAPSWLQVRRVVHVGRDEPLNDALPGWVATTYGVTHLCAEIAHRMAFHADSGRLA